MKLLMLVCVVGMLFIASDAWNINPHSFLKTKRSANDGKGIVVNGRKINSTALMNQWQASLSALLARRKEKKRLGAETLELGEEIEDTAEEVLGCFS